MSGVATAASLFKLGCKQVVVYDKHSSLSALQHSSPPATVVQANGSRVLDVLDLLPVLSASASSIRRITQRNSRGGLRSSFLPSTLLPARAKDGHVLIPSLATSYIALHACLTSHLPASAIQWNRQVSGVERGESGYNISFASSTAEVGRADLIVAADGADSTLRSSVVQAGKGSSPHVMVGLLVEGVSNGSMWEEQQDDELLEVWGNGQRISVVRLLDGTVYWSATVSDSYAEVTSSPRSFAHSLSSLPAWISNLIAATPTASYVARPLRHLQPSAPLYRDGVVLIGSSSALLPPDLHQQTASSLESALTLALSLRSSSTIAAGLQRYSRLRLPRLLSLHTAAVSECGAAIEKSRLRLSLRSLANSLLPSQVRDSIHESAIGYDLLRSFPDYTDGGPKARLFGQAGPLMADRLETDLSDVDLSAAEEVGGESLQWVQQGEKGQRYEVQHRRKKGSKR